MILVFLNINEISNIFFSKLKEVSKKINEIIFCYGTGSSTNEDFLKHIFKGFIENNLFCMKY